MLGPRIINVLLGIWLIISAFIWPHSPQQMNNAWIVGVLCTVIAAIAIAAPAARYLNTALAAWLLISAWVLPAVSAGTVWNSIIVAILVFIFSLLSGERISWPGGRSRASTAA